MTNIMVLLRKTGQCLIAICLILVAAATQAQQTEADIRDADMRAEANALLNTIKNAKGMDAYLHTELLQKELSEEPTPARKSEIYKEILFHALDMGATDLLEQFGELAIELAYSIDDVELQIYGELAKANVLSFDGQLVEAKKMILGARELAERESDEVSVFFADTMLAFIGPEMGNFLEGLSRMAQGAIKLPDTPRGNRMRMMAYLTIGYTYTGVSEVDELIHYYNLAAQLGARTGIGFDRESVFYNIASTLSDQNENQLAEKFFVGLRDILKQTGRTDGEYYVLYGLAWIQYDKKDYTGVIKLAEQALSNYPEDPFFDMSLNDLIAISYAKSGDPVSARAYLEKTKAFFAERPDYASMLPEAQHKLTTAFILRAENNLPAAFDMLDAARRAAAQGTYEQFRDSITDLRSNLETMLAKQEAEARLADTEDAYQRLIVAFSILVAICAALLFYMQRRHNKALKQSISIAELANKTKSDFLANMSHELRTPLNAILGFSEMMTQRIFGELGARQYNEYADHIHGSGQHLLDIINDILDLSKVESGRLQVNETEIDLREMFDDARSVLMPRALERGVGIGVHVDPEVPHLLADRRLIKQVLLNLLSNGVKFTKKEGRVNLIAHLCKDGGIQIEVIDTGVGMTPSELEIALTPFGQAGTTMTRSHEGTGLGLPLVKSLIELHDGDLFIRSKKDVGTTIQLLLPPKRTGHPINQTPVEKPAQK